MMARSKALLLARGIHWVAMNDAPGDRATHEELCSYISVLLLADTFGVSPATVAAHVLRLRRAL